MKRNDKLQDRIGGLPREKYIIPVVSTDYIAKYAEFIIYEDLRDGPTNDPFLPVGYDEHHNVVFSFSITRTFSLQELIERGWSLDKINRMLNYLVSDYIMEQIHCGNNAKPNIDNDGDRR